MTSLYISIWCLFGVMAHMLTIKFVYPEQTAKISWLALSIIVSPIWPLAVLLGLTYSEKDLF